jgi:MinD-like ATPase involved in chromosome partitioning or flagellar assembly
LVKIISTHSYRGGTGKSNMSANLAVMVAKAGKRVALIDTDIQSPGVHVLFKLDDELVTHRLNDFLWGKCRIEEAAYDVTESVVGHVEPDTERPRLFLVPAAVDSNAIGKILRDGYDVGLLNDGFQQLGDRLKLDYLFVDTHPGVNEETLLSIAVSDLLLLVMRPDNQDFQGTAVTAELARRLDVRKMLMVVNKVPTSMDREALAAKVKDLYQADVAGVLPLNEEIVNMASGAIFTNYYPNHAFTRNLAQVAKRVLEEA